MVILVVSCVTLVTFQRLFHPDVSALAAFLPASVLGGSVIAGIGFAVSNALFEELIFRGILFDAVESEWGGRIAVLGTGALFGFGHLHGYPPGYLGAGMAAVYGVSLGWLRVYSAGIGLPVIAHIGADVTIFALLGVFQLA
jgi:hypothetical protein